MKDMIVVAKVKYVVPGSFAEFLYTKEQLETLAIEEEEASWITDRLIIDDVQNVSVEIESVSVPFETEDINVE